MVPDKFIAITRDERGNQAWKEVFEQRGFFTYSLPCISTVPSPLTTQIQSALARFTDFSWVVFTSAAGVRHFAELALQTGLDRRQLTSVWYAAVGPSTADALKALGLVANFVPSRPDAATLARELKRVKSRQILILHTSLAAPVAGDILRRRSAQVTDVPVYHTLPVTHPDPGFAQLVREGSISHIVFASPSAVSGFTARLSEPVALELARNVPAISIGPSVNEALLAYGFRQVQTTTKPNLESVLELLGPRVSL